MKSNTTARALVFGITFLFLNNSFGQTKNESIKREHVLYTFFYNEVPGNFKFPLIGLINVAKGNENTLELGLLNNTQKDFKGVQASLVNGNAGNVNGAQLGLLNFAQITNGIQTGLVNISRKEVHSGLQLGLLNMVLKNTTSNNICGVQLGLVNFGKKVKGVQVGLINIADSVNGLPIGVFSIVKKGGYKAVEVSVNELYPVNLTFKIGVPKLYSFVQGGYNSNYSEKFGLGFGFGSLASMGNKFYFNPEIGILSPISTKGSLTTSFAANFRYNLSSNLQLAVGPSVVWLNHPKEGMFQKPFIHFVNNGLDANNRLLIGLRAALSFGTKL